MDSTKVKIEGGYLSPKISSFDSMGMNDASSPPGETGTYVIFYWTSAGFTAQWIHPDCPYFSPYDTAGVKGWVDAYTNKNNLYNALYPLGCATIT